MKREFHEVANIFPLMAASDLDALAADIKANGQREPIYLHKDGRIVDGRNRYMACMRENIEPRYEQYDGGDASLMQFVISLNLHRRHLNESQRGMVAARIATMERGRPDINASIDAITQDDAADMLNVGRATVQRARVVIEEAEPELVQAVELGKIAVSHAAKIVDSPPEFQRAVVETVSRGVKPADAVKAVRRENADREVEKARNAISDSARKSIASVCDIRHCSMDELFDSGISPDAVITDPPYPYEFIHLYEDLAKRCVNVPVVAVMCGQSYLPEIVYRMTKHIKYRWTIAYMTPGGQAVQLWQSKVNTFWKPVLLFGEAVEWIGDVAKSSVNDNDKRFHEWGQSESGMVDLVERLTSPGQLVCDPFIGAGTTAIASLQSGCRFVGCDIDKTHVEKSIARIEALHA